MQYSYLLFNILFIATTQSVIASNENILPMYKVKQETDIEKMQKGWNNIKQGAGELHVDLYEEIDPADCCMKITKGTTQCLLGSTQMTIGAIMKIWQSHSDHTTPLVKVESYFELYSKQKKQ